MHVQNNDSLATDIAMHEHKCSHLKYAQCMSSTSLSPATVYIPNLTSALGKHYGFTACMGSGGSYMYMHMYTLLVDTEF